MTIESSVQPQAVVPLPIATNSEDVKFEIYAEDYTKACVGSAICPFFGVCATFVCCSTPSGKHGMAQGTKYGFFVVALFTFLIAILVTSKAVTCKDAMTGTNTDYDDCVDISGAVWNATSEECNFNGNCPSKYSFRNTTKDGVLGWCESTDHWTCLGQQSKVQPWVTTAIYIILSLVAAHFAKKFYEERVAASNQGPAIPVYGTPVQPAYEQQV
eukprot:TRINITY_DN282_c0_g1_i2.p1 TRINITY_DN282_c0_g1~~TRINITY_DN282_c0_g1_i2.p1  ORF type:complete len:221 (+),score=37.46 TRINITY_DN282_c0_g1_i2:23-664(+)